MSGYLQKIQYCISKIYSEFTCKYLKISCSLKNWTKIRTGVYIYVDLKFKPHPSLSLHLYFSFSDMMLTFRFFTSSLRSGWVCAKISFIQYVFHPFSSNSIQFLQQIIEFALNIPLQYRYSPRNISTSVL